MRNPPYVFLFDSFVKQGTSDFETSFGYVKKKLYFLSHCSHKYALKKPTEPIFLSSTLLMVALR